MLSAVAVPDSPSLCRYVSAHAPLLNSLRPRGAVDHVPVALAWPPDCEVGLAVPVVVAGHRYVSAHAPLLNSLRPRGAVDHVPVALAWPPDCEVGLAVPVVVISRFPRNQHLLDQATIRRAPTC